MAVREKKPTPRADITPEQVHDLTQAVISLSEQVRVLRQAVDEIGDELGWAIRNRVVFVEPIDATARRIRSMPLDPTAPDFHERVNAIDPDRIGGIEHACDPEELSADKNTEVSHPSPDLPFPTTERRQAKLW